MLVTQSIALIDEIGYAMLLAIKRSEYWLTALSMKKNTSRLGGEMDSTKKTARLAGILYLALVILAPYGMMYVSSKIMVWGNAAATAKNLLANQFLFRTGVASNLISEVLLILIVWVLYHLFKQVNEHQAKLMAILAIVSVPISFLGNVFKITAIKVFKGGLLQSLEPGQINEVGMLLFTMGSYATQMVQLYWGLWLIPFGLLVYKSGFIPKIFGIYLYFGGAAYVILSFIFVLIPEYRSVAFNFAMPFLFSEIAIMLWLLIKGVKVKRVISEG
jgi:Domain of unknown function (DUF4386)